MTDANPVNGPALYLCAKIGRWERNNPQAHSIPPYLWREVGQLNRYSRIEKTDPVMVDPSHTAQLEDIRGRLELDGMARAERRETEDRLADYIESCLDHPTPDKDKLTQIVDDMRHCRRSGTIGLKPAGGYMVAWDSKCSQSRLCPDESREETQRIAEKYVPAMIEWKQSKPTHRLFYAVFTYQNYEQGRLSHGKRQLFKSFKEFCARSHKATPVVWRHGVAAPAGRPRNVPVFPGIRGSLVVQEDPLSARGDWNVHLNVILCVDGRLDYKTLRAEWGANVEIRELKGEPADLAATCLELVKYSARLVPEKSASHAAAGKTAAPSMVEWPAWAFLEWWRAGRKFRRTRSYGCLYKVQLEREPLSLDDVFWCGSMLYGAGGYRCDLITDAARKGVDLIPGDNFSGSPAGRGGILSGYDAGPPKIPKLPPWER